MTGSGMTGSGVIGAAHSGLGTGGVSGAGHSGLGSSGFASRHFGGTGATGTTAAGRLATGGHNMQNNWGRYNNYGGLNNGFYGFGYPFFLFGFPFGYGYGGYGGYGYGGYGYGGYGNYGGYGYPVAYTTSQPTSEQLASATDFTNQGEEAFQAGRYQEAVQKWQHALVDNPNNGGLMLLLSQAMFASGQYSPAAGAVQLGMQALPQDQWGTVVKNYTDLYPNIQNYTDQLRALENARTSSPSDPGLRFLLGYHYGYLGYPTQAVKELDKALTLAPKDIGTQVLRNVFAAQAGMPAIPVTPPPAAPTNQATPGSPGMKPIPATS